MMTSSTDFLAFYAADTCAAAVDHRDQQYLRDSELGMQISHSSLNSIKVDAYKKES